MKIRNTNDLNVSKWAGGTTTEFLIFPETANYADRNFLFRISSATIEEERSLFTSLEAYERILMVLEGSVELNHETGTTSKKVVLEKFGQTRFSGKWKTESKGKITDFNVIFDPSLNPELQILSDERITVPKNEYLFIWCLEGEISFRDQVIATGSFVYGFSETFSELSINGKACFVRLSAELLQTI